MIFHQEANRKFTLTKPEWDSVALERIEMATDPSKSADLAAVIMQEGLAHVCFVTNSLTLVKAKIDINLPRKRRGNTSQHEKALHKFYEVSKAVFCRATSCSKRIERTIQCDQIGRFLKALGNKFTLKSSPKRLLTFGLF